MAKHFRDTTAELEADVNAMFNAADFGVWYEDTGAFPKFSDAFDAFETWASGLYFEGDVELCIARHYAKTLADYIPIYGNAALDALKEFASEYRI